jgi:preprotein translocase subunit SecG
MDAIRGFLHDWRLVLLIIHVGVTAAMIVVILLQRSEGGGLGMGRTDALFSVRGQANVLSRATAIFASIFFFLSLVMAWSMTDPSRATRSFMEGVTTTPATPAAPGAAAPGTAAPGTAAPGMAAPGMAAPEPTAPAAPSAPTR